MFDESEAIMTAKGRLTMGVEVPLSLELAGVASGLVFGRDATVNSPAGGPEVWTLGALEPPGRPRFFIKLASVPSFGDLLLTSRAACELDKVPFFGGRPRGRRSDACLGCELLLA